MKSAAIGAFDEMNRRQTLCPAALLVREVVVQIGRKVAVDLVVNGWHGVTQVKRGPV